MIGNVLNHGVAIPRIRRIFLIELPNGSFTIFHWWLVRATSFSSFLYRLGMASCSTWIVFAEYIITVCSP